MKKTKAKKTIKTHDDFVKEVAGEFIEMLEAGTAPWQQEWDAGVVGVMHHNTSTSKEYQGINQLYLDMQAMKKGYKDVRWLTYRQAREMGAQVRKDEKSTKVEYWDWYFRKGEKDQNGNVVEEENKKRRPSPRVFFASVFNGEQIDGLEPAKEPKESVPNFDLHAMADCVLKNSGVPIYYRGSQALYSPVADVIKLPPLGAFEDAEGYYATALHELAHATGHEKRLARKFGIRGTNEYAREELRAEIGSYMVAKSAGLPHRPQNQASYVASWVKRLKDDPREIYHACRDASLIQQWVLEPDKRQELEKRSQEQAKKNRKVTSRKPEVVAMSESSQPKISPENSLQEAMQGMGLNPNSIIWDGKWHRCPVSDDSGDKTSGTYKAHQDGIPNAFITNHKTGENLKWVYDGHELSKEDLGTLRKEGAARKVERDKELQAKQETSAKRAYGIWKNAKPANDHPYLNRKGIDNHDNLIRMNQETGQLFIPVRSIEGKLQSLQTIDKDGNKSFLRHGKIEGGMLELESKSPEMERKELHSPKLLGGHPKEKPVVIAETRRFELVEKKPEPGQLIVIAEGYATAKSIHDATGLATVVAFSAHQIKNVATALHDKYPDRSLVLAADNDKVGLETAQQAAELLPCKVIVPSFNRQEQEKGLTDFNDLACSRGSKEIKRQFEKVLERPKAKEKELA